MADTAELLFDELAEIATAMAALFTGTPQVVARVASLAFSGASGIAHVLTAEDLEAMRAGAVTSAAGRAAWLESRRDHALRCTACGHNFSDCEQSSAGKCCPDCSHPSRWLVTLYDGAGRMVTEFETLSHDSAGAIAFGSEAARGHVTTRGIKAIPIASHRRQA